MAFLNTMISDLCADEADQGKWSIDAALSKFKSSEEKYWKVALKSGVELNGKIFEKHICNKTPEDYADYEARYEVAFVTPCSHQVIMKVRFLYNNNNNNNNRCLNRVTPSVTGLVSTGALYNVKIKRVCKNNIYP